MPAQRPSATQGCEIVPSQKVLKGQGAQAVETDSVHGGQRAQAAVPALLALPAPQGTQAEAESAAAAGL